MSKKDVLYVKGMNMSDIECPEDDAAWDDAELTRAYDRALKMASVGVAKRLAMSTNTLGSKGKQTKSSKKKWAVGDHCRAVYEEDGLEYEATVKRIISDKECIISFLGYGNTEIVPLDSMKPSHGKEAQKRQIEQCEAKEESDGSLLERDSVRGRTPEAMDHSPQKKDKKKKNRGPSVVVNGFQLPDVHNLPMPNIGKRRRGSLSGMDMPIPNMPIQMPMPMPIPPFIPDRSGNDSEDEGVTSMLLSWYMSGYYTGLYQGMKRSNHVKRRKD